MSTLETLKILQRDVSHASALVHYARISKAVQLVPVDFSCYTTIQNTKGEPTASAKNALIVTWRMRARIRLGALSVLLITQHRGHLMVIIMSVFFLLQALLLNLSHRDLILILQLFGY